MTTIIRNAGLGSPAALPTTTGLKLADGLPFDEWEEIGEAVVQQGEAFVWCMGDWLVYGERTYGGDDRYRDALARVNVKYDALKNYAWVSRNVERSTRVDGLSWSHHRAVASLKQEIHQRDILDAALRLGWTVPETEDAVRNLKERLSLESGEPVTKIPSSRPLVFRVVGEDLSRLETAAAYEGKDPDEWMAEVVAKAVEETIARYELVAA